MRVCRNIGLLKMLGAIGIFLAPVNLSLATAATTGFIRLTVGGITHPGAAGLVRLTVPALGLDCWPRRLLSADRCS